MYYICKIQYLALAKMWRIWEHTFYQDVNRYNDWKSEFKWHIYADQAMLLPEIYFREMPTKGLNKKEIP